VKTQRRQVASRLVVALAHQAAVPRVRALLDPGFQYVIFIVLPFDSESLKLLAERMLPATPAS